MINSNVTSIQHEPKAEDVFDNLLDQIDAPPEFLAVIDDVVNGRLIVHCKDGTELNCPQDKISFIIKLNKGE
jgi:hypothetical protein